MTQNELVVIGESLGMIMGCIGMHGAPQWWPET